MFTGKITMKSSFFSSSQASGTSPPSRDVVAAHAEWPPGRLGEHAAGGRMLDAGCWIDIIEILDRDIDIDK